MSRMHKQLLMIAASFAASLGTISAPAAAQDYSDRPWWEDERPWNESRRPVPRPTPRDRYEDPYDQQEGFAQRPRRWQDDDSQDFSSRDEGQTPDQDWQQEQETRRPVPPSRRFTPPQNDFDDSDDRAEERNAGKVVGVDGGPRPYIAAEAPPMVAFSGSYQPGSVVIDTNARKLYYVTRPMAAYAYPIGVGRDGFAWTGTKKVSRIADWPDWYPPAEMRKRKPELPERMLGGIRNPLGAKAIYLGTSLYRIHGTNDPKSIGRAESSGCFRMLNAHVLHLASLVQVGTQVTVVKSLGRPAVAASEPKTQKRTVTTTRPQVVIKVRPRITQDYRQPPWRERPARRYRWWEYDDPYDYR